MTLAPSIDQAASIVRRSRRDPSWWAETILGKHLWPGQVDILESVIRNKKTAVKSCHAAGKSFVSAIAVLWWESVYKGGIALTTAPTYRQVKKVIWEEIRRCYNTSIVPIGGECLTTELKLGDGWYAMGLSTRDPDSFQGKHSYTGRVLVIMDEASGIERELWPAIDGVTTGDDCRILEIGNPTDPVSMFAEDCTSPMINTIKISAFDTPNFLKFDITMEDITRNLWRDKINGVRLPAPHLITPGWVYDRYVSWGEDSPLFQARVLAEFPDQSSNKLIPLSWIEKAHNNDLNPGSVKRLGVDIARYGGDETTIYHRMGNVVRRYFSAYGTSVTESAGRVIIALRETGSDCASVDAVGMGAGVVDQLREQQLPVKELNGSTKPADPDRFLNARAEWFWKLRDLFDPALPGDIDLDPTDEDLTAQLCNIEYKVTSHGKIQIESKEDMKRRGLCSPDRADALCNAFADPAPEELPEAGTWGRRRRVLH